MTGGRFEKLLAMVEEHPEASFPLYGLAMERRSRGELEEAAGLFKQLLEQDSDYIAGYLQYGMTLVDLGRDGEAGEVYREGIRRCWGPGREHTRQELQAALEAL